MIPVNELATTRHGTVCVHRFDAYVGQSCLLYGEFSGDEVDFLAALVGPGSVVIDGGANVGAITLPLARRVGAFGLVVAIEPQRLTFQALCATVASNHLTNVRTEHAALGKARGEILVPPLDITRAQNVGGFSVKGHGAGEPVRMLAIDDLKLPHVTLIKLDLEGMERDALSGAADTIRRCQPMLYVENDREEHSAALLEDMKRLGYRCFWHKPPLYRRNNFRDVRHNIFPGIVSVNVLALPKHDTRDFGLEKA